MGEADVVDVCISDLVAVIAVDTVSINPLHPAQIEIGRIGEFDGRSMTGGTHSRSILVIGQEVPAYPRFSLPVAAVEEVEEAAVGRCPGMAAGRPFPINLAVTVPAPLRFARIRRRIDPGVALAI